MTQSNDVQQMIAAVNARLTGPGTRFEMQEEEVLGVRLPVAIHRERSLGAVLADSAQFGDRDYLVTDSARLSYTEHLAAVAALAKALKDRYGIEKGDRVGIAGANTVEWIESFWAAQTLGAIVVGYNAWWVGPELAYGIENAGPKVIIADAKRVAQLTELGADVPVLSMEEGIPALINEFAGAPLELADVDEDDPAVILYTSGTSGRPKGVVHSHRNLIAVINYHRFSDALLAAFSGQDPDAAIPSDRRYLLTGPLFHVASLHNLIVPRLATGSAVVIYQGSFNAERALALIEKEKVTTWAVVPTMAQRIIDVENIERFDLSSMTALALSAAPTSTAVQQKLREKLPVAESSLVDSYGMTESSGAITVANPMELAANPGSLGSTIPGVKMEIRDPEGNPVPEGVEGQVCTQSANVMLGYWNNEAATADTFAPDRWLLTGDYGTVRGGQLYLTGRRSDLILRGGENVYPVEIEQVIDEHPAVAECAVIGVPDKDLGSAVGAVVVVESGQQVTEQELVEFVGQRLAHFKVPAHWRVTTDPLPRNATGKTIRTKVEI
ncbi:class I adenylate-forming enzyme family protein [Jongsikchunia kroppenstedtii]|uniref:class I adenylate-forming enzyme family protein n=1 Tax=Jongsikchunia kroppenstedtii TaxID=1121721 RepID=UPI0003723545|nr:class I adenylate-forming enzyme family protein [Jongsikchunia kroppenstedtii]